MHPLKALSVLFSALVVMGAAACGQLAQSVAEGGTATLPGVLVKPETVQAVQQQASKPGAIAHLKGKVGRRVPLIGGTAYELQDATGTIWVVTKGIPPNQGDNLVVRGTVRYQSVQMHGKEQGSAYIEQQELLERTPASQK